MISPFESTKEDFEERNKDYPLEIPSLFWTPESYPKEDQIFLIIYSKELV